MSEPSHNQKAGTTLQSKAADYGNVLAGVFELLDKASRARVKSNTFNPRMGKRP
jgi:hypothetical protein